MGREAGLREHPVLACGAATGQDHHKLFAAVELVVQVVDGRREIGTVAHQTLL